jgi:hypothetical protein
MIPTPGLTNMTHTALFKKNSDVLSRNSYIQYRSRIPFPKLELSTLACHTPANRVSGEVDDEKVL